MADQRRGWIFIAILGLAVAYCSWKPGAKSGEEQAKTEPDKPTEGASHMQGPRTAQEYERQVKEAREAQMQRARDRKALLENREIRAEWITLAHDRAIGRLREQRKYELISSGVRSFRGMERQTVVDRASGSKLEIGSGDIADRYTDATLTIGESGPVFRFLMFWARDPDGYTVVSIHGAEVYDFAHSFGGPDDQYVTKLERLVALLSWDNPKFEFGRRIGPAFVVDQRKHQYFGPGGTDRYSWEKTQFLDHYVDELYASRGVNPAYGRRNPDLIGHPDARRPLKT